MNILSFEELRYGNYGIQYNKHIGNYSLAIYTGVWGITESVPNSSNLPFNKYSIVGVAIINNNTCITLEDIGLDFPYGKIPENRFYYNLKIEDVNILYNKLCELSGLPIDNLPTTNVSNVRKEKACRCCGRMNDIGATPCWCCDVSKPTY